MKLPYILLAVVTVCTSGCSRDSSDITARDLAWALDQHIWKIDISEFGTVYGVRIIVFDGDEKMRWIARVGSDERPIDTSAPVMVAMRAEGTNIVGRIGHQGTAGFRIDNAVGNRQYSWYGLPKREGDLFLLLATQPTQSTPENEKTIEPMKVAVEVITKQNIDN